MIEYGIRHMPLDLKEVKELAELLYMAHVHNISVDVVPLDHEDSVIRFHPKNARDKVLFLSAAYGRNITVIVDE